MTWSDALRAREPHARPWPTGRAARRPGVYTALGDTEHMITFLSAVALTVGAGIQALFSYKSWKKGAEKQLSALFAPQKALMDSLPKENESPLTSQQAEVLRAQTSENYGKIRKFEDELVAEKMWFTIGWALVFGGALLNAIATWPW